ncbi:hypothetical protein ACH5RR_026519 [Cinchona calisaya]|uniref:Uncharacterized protein n=1 Tax=Cinchona calisaya TaxID=153742 RepID=A0ABD2Z5Z5_9GENT
MADKPKWKWNDEREFKFFGTYVEWKLNGQWDRNLLTTQNYNKLAQFLNETYGMAVTADILSSKYYRFFEKWKVYNELCGICKQATTERNDKFADFMGGAQCELYDIMTPVLQGKTATGSRAHSSSQQPEDSLDIYYDLCEKLLDDRYRGMFLAFSREEQLGWIERMTKIKDRGEMEGNYNNKGEDDVQNLIVQETGLLFFSPYAEEYGGPLIRVPCWTSTLGGKYYLVDSTYRIVPGFLPPYKTTLGDEINRNRAGMPRGPERAIQPTTFFSA